MPARRHIRTVLREHRDARRLDGEFEQVARGHLLAAVLRVVADHGTTAVSEVTVARAANVSERSVAEAGTPGMLLREAALFALREPVLSRPSRKDPAPTVAEALLRMTSEHRRYVDADPTRFAAIVQFAAAALFGCPDLQTPLAARNRSTCEAAAAWFGLLQRRGQADPSIEPGRLARTFVGTMNGIEMAHLIDREPALRIAAYEDAHTAFAASLTAERISHVHRGRHGRG